MRGWHQESYRHYLASKGIASKVRGQSPMYLAAKGVRTRYFAEKPIEEQIAQEKFDLSRLKRLSSGSDRVVFELDDGKHVLKVARTPRGLQQNVYEEDHLVGAEPKYAGRDFIVVEKLNKPGKATTEMLKDLEPFSSQDFDRKTSEVQEAMEKHDLSDYGNYDLAWGDFTRKSSWGERDGKPVLADKGALSLGSVKSKEPWADREWEEVKQRRRQVTKEGRERLFANIR